MSSWQHTLIFVGRRRGSNFARPVSAEGLLSTSGQVASVDPHPPRPQERLGLGL